MSTVNQAWVEQLSDEELALTITRLVQVMRQPLTQLDQANCQAMADILSAERARRMVGRLPW